MTSSAGPKVGRDSNESPCVQKRRRLAVSALLSTRAGTRGPGRSKTDLRRRNVAWGRAPVGGGHRP